MKQIVTRVGMVEDLLELSFTPCNEYKIFQTEEELGEGLQSYLDTSVQIIIANKYLECGFGFCAIFHEDDYMVDWSFTYIKDLRNNLFYYEQDDLLISLYNYFGGKYSCEEISEWGCVIYVETEELDSI